VAGKEKPLLCQKTQIDLTRRVSLYAALKNMTRYDWEDFPSCHIENYGICGPNLHEFWYPYPHSSKPISVNMGTGFKQVWMWVLIELPMDYDRLYYSHSTLFHFRLRLILRKSMPEFQHISD